MKKDKELNLKTIKQLRTALKKYKKENGSFNLVEVEEKDGNRIVITI